LIRPVDAGEHAGLARGRVNFPTPCFVLHFIDALVASIPTGPKRQSISVYYLTPSLPNVLANPVMVETSGKDPTAKQDGYHQDN
jgi:hypothetical protein